MSDENDYLEFDNLTVPERIANYLLLLLYIGTIIPNVVQLVKYSSQRQVGVATSPWISFFISLAIISR